MHGLSVLRGVASASFIGALLLATPDAIAQTANYPNRAITLVLPFAAGSGTDTTTRLIAKELGTALNANTVIDNKAGANGSIAAIFVARAPRRRLHAVRHDQHDAFGQSFFCSRP